MSAIICTKCGNWNKQIKDCDLDHTVYLTQLGVYYTNRCDDYYEDDGSAEIDKMVSNLGYDDEGDNNQEDEGYYEEERPRVKLKPRPIESSQEDEGYYEEERPRVKLKPRPIESNKPNRNRVDENVSRKPLVRKRPDVPQKTERSESKEEHFAQRAKTILREREQKAERLSRKLLNEEIEDDYDPNDPLEELKREQSAQTLSDLHSFAENVKMGKVTPEQIEKEIQSLNGENVQIDEADIEMMKEEARRRCNVTGLNEAQKRKQGEKK